jgi:hypothetical protein
LTLTACFLRDIVNYVTLNSVLDVVLGFGRSSGCQNVMEMLNFEKDQLSSHYFELFMNPEIVCCIPFVLGRLNLSATKNA